MHFHSHINILHHWFITTAVLAVFKTIYILHIIIKIQAGSGAHPASYPVGIRGSFPGGKAAGA